jgi:hypothetical protein
MDLTPTHVVAIHITKVVRLIRVVDDENFDIFAEHVLSTISLIDELLFVVSGYDTYDTYRIQDRFGRDARGVRGERGRRFYSICEDSSVPVAGPIQAGNPHPYYIENHYDDYYDTSSDSGSHESEHESENEVQHPSCAICYIPFIDGDPVDGVLTEVLHNLTWKNYFWFRRSSHIACIPATHEGQTFLPIDIKHVGKRERSAQALLLLQELGLPWDVAWPITALAYWIL